MALRSVKRAQRGAVLVETVVVLPILLFLTVLSVEVTSAFVDFNTLTKAARNGVRHVAANAILGTTGVVTLTPELVSDTRNLVVYGNAAGTGEAVLSGFAAGNVVVSAISTDVVQVSATYNYTGILGATLSSFGYGTDSSLAHSLRATVSMRAL